jgi:hypothetical protein
MNADGPSVTSFREVIARSPTATAPTSSSAIEWKGGYHQNYYLGLW